jgi:3-oxoadipate enol-lactonase
MLATISAARSDSLHGLWGTHDPATPAGDGRALHAAIRASRYLELDASHLSAWECADEFARAVVQHLAEGEEIDG